MAKVGLIAGGGGLPIEFVRSAKNAGDKVVVFAVEGMAFRQIEEEAVKVYWLNIGQYKKFVFLLLKEGIRRLAFIGKVEKNVIYNTEVYDDEASQAMRKLRDKKDYSILKEATKRLKLLGVEVIDSSRYLTRLLPEKGILSATTPDERMEEDIKFGYDIAKRISGMDVGQTVVVKDKAVVAVEAMEGTNATIARAREVAGEGCVMVKVSRPDQDMRWDVPTVGLETMEELIKNGFSAIAFESGKMFLLEKDKFLERANSDNVVVRVI